MKPVKRRGKGSKSNGGGIESKYITCLYGNTTMKPFVELKCAIKNKDLKSLTSIYTLQNWKKKKNKLNPKQTQGRE
jgi:hypothetical protein